MKFEYPKFNDNRGSLYTIYDKRLFEGYNIEFVQTKISHSVKGTIRGFHGDWKTWKLISVVYGTVKLVTYDLTTHEKETHYLSHKDDLAKTILVKPGVLNGHQCLSDECVFHYAWSEYYTSPEDQISIYFRDSTINPNWDRITAITSKRDFMAPSYEEYMRQEQKKYD